MGIESRNYYRDPDEAWSPVGGVSMRSMVMILIVVNVGIFFLDPFTTTLRPGVHWLGNLMTLKPDLFLKPWNFLQLLSYGFAHAAIDSKFGAMHVFGNMLTLFFLGRLVEGKYGRWEFLRFYLAAIVAGGLGYVIFGSMRGAGSGTIGASGAVTAVVMLFILNYPRQTLNLFGVVAVPAWGIGVLLIGLDVLRCFDKDSQVAVETHLAGAAFAAAYYFGKWNFGAWIPNRFVQTGQAGQLQLHDPESESSSMDRAWKKLQVDADRILDKINRQGENSLTWSERRTLKRYSKKLREKRG